MKSEKKTDAPRESHRRLLDLLVWFLLVCAVSLGGGILIRNWTRPSPKIPIPEIMDSLDPQIQAYLEKYIERAQKHPKKYEVHAELGNIYAAHDIWLEARICFQNANLINPRQPLCRFHEALATQELDDPDLAIELMQNLVEDFKSFAPARVHLGAAFIERGKIEEAIVVFEGLLAQDPNSSFALAGLGEAKVMSREYDAAIPLLQRALELNSKDPVSHYLLGTALLRTGEKAKGTYHISQGTGEGRTVMPDQWTVFQWHHAMDLASQIDRAFTYLDNKEPEKAAQILENALAWHPDNFAVANNLAIAYMDLSKFEAACDILLTTRAKHNSRFETLINLAAVQLFLKQTEAALESATLAVKKAPKVAKAHAILGRVHKQCGRSQNALDSWRTAISLDAENNEHRAEIAGLCLSLGRFEEAREHLQGLLKRMPNNFAAQARLCTVCIRLGRWEEAETSLEAARRLLPDHPDLANLTRQLSRAKGE